MYEIKIELSSDMPINIHYNHALQSNLYKYIGAENHDYPGVKVFTFSRIIPMEEESFAYDNNKKTIFISRGYLVFRTLIKDIAERLALGLKQNRFIDIYGSKLLVTNITTKKINIERNNVLCCTISPVSIKNKDKKEYLNPVLDTNTFEFAIEKGIINKAKRIGVDAKDIAVEIIDVSSINLIKYTPKVIFETYNLILRMRGDSELINIAYSAGIGQKTGCGLGCLNIL